jgi:hypothetical protein
MLKKSLPALPDLNKGFVARVASLAREGGVIAKSYAALSERMLKFAQRIKDMSDDARALDGGGGVGEHQSHLRQQLLEALGTDSEPVVSKWLKIGEHAENLLPHSASLPPQRECLYEVAKAAGDNKPIGKWIEEEKLTVNSTVREVLQLTKAKKRGKKKEKEFTASVIMSFKTYTDAYAALKSLLDAEPDCKIRAADAFWEELRSDISNDEEFKEAKKRLSN